MAKKFLELDEQQAKFFEFSKEQKPGFEEHKSINGKISYRKYYNEGVKGVLKFINEREEEFTKGKVKKLSIVLENGEDRLYATFNIMTAKGNMNQYVEQLIPFMPNMKVGEAYRLYPYEMESTYTDAQGNEKTGKNRGVSVATWDLESDVKLLKVDRAHSFAKEGGDIPQVVWEKEEDMGVIKNIKNDKERRNFLYKVLQGVLTPYTPNESQPSTPATQTEKPKEQPSAPTTEFKDEEYDDLPF